MSRHTERSQAQARLEAADGERGAGAPGGGVVDPLGRERRKEGGPLLADLLGLADVGRGSALAGGGARLLGGHDAGAADGHCDVLQRAERPQLHRWRRRGWGCVRRLASERE